MPLTTKADSGTAPSSMRITRMGMIGRLRMLRRAEREEHRRLRREQDTERGDELRQRRSGPERPEDRELDQDTDDDHEHVREHDRRRGGEREAELARAESPEREPGEHGDRARGEVDEAGAAVGDDDTDRDCGDRRPVPSPSSRKRRISFSRLVRITRRGRPS